VTERADAKQRDVFTPLYSDGKYHGPDLDLRTHGLPIFKRNGVNAVLSGHEHV
jgi:hypothetical protein